MQQSGRLDESFAINVASVVSSRDNKLKNVSVSMAPSYCIFETPGILSRHMESSFRPSSFSIGPIYHGKKKILATDKIKIKYLNGLLSRVIENHLPKMMSEEEKEIKKQEILTGHDFVAELGDEFEIMVLDGCFNIELLGKYAKQISKDDNPIFSMSCMLQFLHHDLILLENQVPWLVLQTLFDQTKLPFETKSLIELTLGFFETVFTSYPPDLKKTTDICSGQDIKHVLDLLRLSQVLPSEEIKNKPQSGWQQIHSLTKLKEAGVKFERVQPDSILDIKFTDGRLKIPSLLIQETTETILRNLITYEQCLPNCPPIFTCYAKLLDNLIDTPNDMDILCKKKIYYNWLIPEDATQFFNKLNNDAYVKKLYYSNLCADMDKHCRHLWPKWRAYYVHNYFTKPWAIASQIYALIMFILTFWQL